MSEEDLDDMVSELERDLMFLQDKYDQIQDKMGQIEDFKNDLEKHVDVQASNIDFDRLAEFVSDKYWLVNQKDDSTYEIFIPNFMDVQAGVLDRQKGGYNVFILDQTTKMISGIPEFLQDEVDLEVEQRFKVKGDLLEFDEEQKSTVENELDEHVEDVKDDRATIKQDHGHSLVRDLLERGEMPFTPTPVDENDIRDSETEHELRPYQERAFQEWMDHGAITVCFMTGAGKTHIGMEAFDVLNYDEETGRKAVVVFSKITAKQWKNRIEKYAPRMKPVIMSGKDVEDIPEGEEVVEIYTYQALHKMEEMINSGHEYIMIQFDEADFLPAKTFSKASTYPAKYRMGHTASPVRSRESPNDVFALCGKPVGMNWQETLEHMEQEMFPVNIHVVKDRDEKIDRTEEILDPEKTTVIVVWNIDYGEKVAERLGLDFVHGETNGDQKEKIQDAIERDNAVVASQIVRRGVTLETIERIIELDRRGDSRRDTLQLVGRLFHGHGELAEIVYTIGEANSFEDTFYGLIEKGFEMNDVDDALEMDELGDQADSIVDIEIEEEEEEIPIQRKVQSSTTVEEDPIEFLKDERVKEIIDERADNYDQLGKGTIWEGVIAIAQEQSESGNGLSHKNLVDLDIVSSNASRITKPLREDPAILVKDDGEWVLNIEEINEIKKKEEEKAEKKEKIQDLKQEVGIE
jgi:superfamily II DNA or RNA helicase